MILEIRRPLISVPRSTESWLTACRWLAEAIWLGNISLAPFDSLTSDDTMVRVDPGKGCAAEKNECWALSSHFVCRGDFDVCRLIGFLHILSLCSKPFWSFSAFSAQQQHNKKTHEKHMVDKNTQVPFWFLAHTYNASRYCSLNDCNCCRLC